MKGRFALAVMTALLAPACAVGPAYKPPTAPVPEAYKEMTAAAETLRPAEPQDDHLRGAWWEGFGDAGLNTLEAEVDVSNQTIAQAEAQYRGARAEVRLARSGLFPTLTTTPSAVRTSGGPSSSSSTTGGAPPTVSIYQVPVDFSWEADVFGRIRRTIEASTEGALDYFTVRGLDAERELLDSTVEGYEKTLQLTRNRYEQGVVSGVDVAQAQTQLETTRAQATDLRLASAQVGHAIAVLLGKPPAEFTLPPGAMPAIPPGVPVGLPSDLLERRPDIAAAERRVAAANAGIGIARSAYFPTFTLAASGGYQSSVLASFFSLPNRFWSLGAAALETIFSGGRRRAASEVAFASYDASVAAYRQSVLSAFQEVEDNLAALHLLEYEATQEAAAVAAAEHLVALANNRYQGGVTSYLEVVTAQAVALTNERTATDLQVRRMVASVNLVKALGGGWSVSDLPDRAAIVHRDAPAAAGASAPAAGASTPAEPTH
jgi:outer membrane protein TolC